MARARTLRAEAHRHEILCSLSPLHRWLFAGLWTIADRDGRLEDRPKRIKAEVLAYDDCDCNRLLDDLAMAGFIQRYVDEDGHGVIAIPSWPKHQHPHPKEPKSILSKPNASTLPSTTAPPLPFPANDPAGSSVSSMSSVSSGSTVPSETEVAPPARKRSQFQVEQDEVLAHYASELNQLNKFVPGDYSIVGQALKWGFSVAELKQVIDGAKKDDWGGRPGQVKLGQLFGTGDQIRHFIARATGAAKVKPLPYDPKRQNLAPVQNKGRVRGEFKFDEDANRRLQAELAAKAKVQ